MNILVTGRNGQVGWELVRRGEKYGVSVVGLTRQELDICDDEAVRRALQDHKPNVLINAAAYTAVDRAESDSEEAFRVNRDGVACLAKACVAANVPFIHVSTDYVFDGKSSIPYLENDPVSPLGVYGRSKEAGEQEIRSLCEKHIILRTAWVYGVHGNNFVKTMLRLGRERDEIGVVADQFGCPTFAGSLAEAILAISERIVKQETQQWGTYHFCGNEVLSWYDFAKQIFDIADRRTSLQLKKLKPITTAEYPTPAQRPPNSGLDCSLVKKTFGLTVPPWKAALQEMLNELFDMEASK